MLQYVHDNPDHFIWKITILIGQDNGTYSKICALNVNLVVPFKAQFYTVCSNSLNTFYIETYCRK